MVWMVWCGMVWCGVVWCGVVWYGMVWYGMAWHGMAWHGMVEGMRRCIAGCVGERSRTDRHNLLFVHTARHTATTVPARGSQYSPNSPYLCSLAL